MDLMRYLQELIRAVEILSRKSFRESKLRIRLCRSRIKLIESREIEEPCSEQLKNAPSWTQIFDCRAGKNEIDEQNFSLEIS